MDSEPVKITQTIDEENKLKEMSIEVQPDEVCINCPYCAGTIRFQPSKVTVNLHLTGRSVEEEKQEIINTVKEARKNKEI